MWVGGVAGFTAFGDAVEEGGERRQSCQGVAALDRLCGVDEGSVASLTVE